VHQLSPADDRQAAARLQCIGFDTDNCDKAAATTDIVSMADGLFRGNNWYPLESHPQSQFRWVNNDAEIFAAESAFGREAFLDIEPGPGFGGKPLDLQIITKAGKVLAEEQLTSRRTISFTIPRATNGVEVLRLHSKSGGSPFGRDTRTLTFRVFGASLQNPTAISGTKPTTTDIVPGDGSVAIGAGWYAVESQNGESFRWVSNDAVFNASGTSDLAIDIEPGPGADSKPLVLRVFDKSGHQIQADEITRRQTLTLYLQPGASGNTYRLHVDGGGKKVANDPRTLNFRVFHIGPRLDASVDAGDIVPAGGRVQIAKGWYPLEVFKGEKFRWVDNDARFVLSSPSRVGKILVDLQPGPGMGSEPLVIKVLDSEDKLVRQVEVKGRRQITIDLPRSNTATATYRLHVDGGGRATPGDPRRLNFRVFSLAPM
jgi:hypothetical protein